MLKWAGSFGVQVFLRTPDPRNPLRLNTVGEAMYFLITRYFGCKEYFMYCATEEHDHCVGHTKSDSFFISTVLHAVNTMFFLPPAMMA